MREKLNVTIRDRRKPKMREMPHTQKTKNGRKLTVKDTTETIYYRRKSRMCEILT